MIISTAIGLDPGSLSFVSKGLLIFLTLSLAMLCYKKYKNVNFDLRKLSSIPILVITFLVCKSLYFLSFAYLTPSTNGDVWLGVQRHVQFYKFMFVFFLLVISCVVFYSSRNENIIKISD